MKNAPLFIAAIGLVLLLTLTSMTNNQSNIDFQSLSAIYGQDQVSRLQNLYSVLLTKNLSDLQIQLMLSQALHETGLFTSAPNYNLMDNQNNFAGITKNSRYPVSPNTYAVYPDLDSFVNDWLLILRKGAQPINATSVDDFASRLKVNGYYGDSLENYDAALNNYFDILNQYSFVQS